MKNGLMTFEVGKVYLLTHKHKAFGGGTWQAACKALTDEYINLGARTYKLSTVAENFEVLACLGDYDFGSNHQPEQPKSIIEQNNHGNDEHDEYCDEEWEDRNQNRL